MIQESVSELQIQIKLELKRTSSMASMHTQFAESHANSTRISIYLIRLSIASMNAAYCINLDAYGY